MNLSDFDFDLPDGLIATRPARPRSAARLLVVRPDRLVDAIVTDLVDLLRPGDRLVLNDTRVIPARLTGTRVRPTRDGSGRARVELTLTEARPDGAWEALGKPMRKLRLGDRLVFDGLEAEVVDLGARVVVRFDAEGDALDAAIDRAGAMPLPPYIAAKRPADEADKTDYQTCWAAHKGAVAAPTASLHFDGPLLDKLAAMGVAFTYVTLHVGAGTFLPVKVDDIADHKMHSEWGEVSAKAAAEVNATKAAGGRVIAVGTTALRLIESAARNGALAPWEGPTDIFITPGFRFQIADGLMTNFHLPKSTLMMLVSALMGVQPIKDIYAHAIAQDYRFFSYGDASLLLPR